MTAVLSSPEISGDYPFDLMGVRVHALKTLELNALVARAIALGKRWIIANHNLHSVYLYHHNSKIRAFFAEADYVHIDGMPIVYLGKLLGLPLTSEHRTTYIDWCEPLMQEAAQKGWRVFILGSKPGVAEQGAQVLREKLPGLQIATAHGYFDTTVNSVDNQAVISKINDYQPHLLMVGMGMPRQEHWVLENYKNLSVNAIVNSGAMIDYVAGVVPTPPRWAGQLGAEWLFRLISEPSRLWHRYLVEPWFILKLFVAEYCNRLLRKLWIAN